MKLRYLLAAAAAAAAGLMASAAGAHAQCAGNIGVTTIHNCAPGVSVQLSDEIFAWQINQNPHTRRITAGQIIGTLNSGTQVGSPSTSDNLVMAPNGTTPQLVSIGTVLGMIPNAGVTATAPATASAAGTNQASATQLTASTTIANSVASGTGVVLASAVNATQTIVNAGANPLAVYPRTGMAIGGASANAPIQVPVGGTVSLVETSATQAYILFASPLLTANLPTSLPSTSGVLWNNGGALCIS
jgi:hypothetical protein